MSFIVDLFKKSAKEKGESIAKRVRGNMYERETPFAERLAQTTKRKYAEAKQKAFEKADEPLAPKLVGGFRKASEAYGNISEGDRVSKIRKQGLGKTYQSFGSQGLGFLYGSRKSKGRRTKTRTTRRAFDFMR